MGMAALATASNLQPTFAMTVRLRCILPVSPIRTSRRHITSHRTIKEHDILFIRQHGPKAAKWVVTPPLRHDTKVKVAFGATLEASDLIGRKILDKVVDSKGLPAQLREVSLASYIILRARSVTPIYPHDANTIISLLNLEPTRPGEEEPSDDDAPFEIFEAGTGLGSLTLHLARAIHAANVPVSPRLRSALVSASVKPRERAPDTDSSSGGDPSSIQVYRRKLDLSPEDEATFESYRAERRAVIHTLDNRPVHTADAIRFIRDFNRAMYLPSIDFHTGSIEAYISSRLASNSNKPFLSRAILDLPGAQAQAVHLMPALHSNASLLIFAPSISQIADFDKWAFDQPLKLETVLELPNTAQQDSQSGLYGGGRPWDVKMVTPRAKEGEKTAERVQVLRPKIGDRLAGGGFVALYRNCLPDPVQNGESPEAGEHAVISTEAESEELEEDSVESLSDEQPTSENTAEDAKERE